MRIELSLIQANQEAIKQLGKEVKILQNNVEILKNAISNIQIIMIIKDNKTNYEIEKIKEYLRDIQKI